MFFYTDLKAANNGFNLQYAHSKNHK